VPFDDLYLYIMIGCAHEQKTAVATTDRHGQYKTQFCDACGINDLKHDVASKFLDDFKR
jgi:hypothetical protein